MNLQKQLLYSMLCEFVSQVRFDFDLVSDLHFKRLTCSLFLYVIREMSLHLNLTYGDSR